MYYRGKMFGFVHLYNGQEAVSTGVIKQLRKDDYVTSTYRDHVHAVSKGCPPKEVMAELFGKSTGLCRGQGGSMHMFSKEFGVLGGFAFIGEGIPVATGAAFRTRYLREVMNDAEKYDQVSVAFFGDGTANNGAFYECLNMASLYKLPIIFVVENNLWAIGMNHWRATAPSLGDAKPHIYKKGEPFGMPGVLVDGMDVLKVREVAQTAIARARAGEGPTLIEAETYRFRGHSLADPDELRSKEEKDYFQAKDPIPVRWVNGGRAKAQSTDLFPPFSSLRRWRSTCWPTRWRRRRTLRRCARRWRRLWTTRWPSPTPAPARSAASCWRMCSPTPRASASPGTGGTTTNTRASPAVRSPPFRACGPALTFSWHVLSLHQATPTSEAGMGRHWAPVDARLAWQCYAIEHTDSCTPSSASLVAPVSV